MRLAALTLVLAACSSSGLVDPPPPPGSPPPAAPSLVVTAPVAVTPARRTTTPLRIELGDVAPGEEIAVTIPPHALGFVVIARAADGEPIGVESIASPSGTLVHEAYTPAGGDHPSTVSELVPITTAAVPMSESPAANPPAPGTWKVRFGYPAGGGRPGKVFAAAAQVQLGAPAGFLGGRLDLDVHVPGGLRLDGRSINAGNAPGDPAVEARLAAFFSGLRDLFGLDRGEIRFHDAETDLLAIDTTQRMLSGFAAPEETQSLHVLFTSAIDLGNGRAAWGVAPAIPGVGAELGRVIVAVGEASADADGLALLHEVGHFFGLAHTTELSGAYGDPLADTARCAGFDGNALVGCADANNVMFPSFAHERGATLSLESSPAQRRVFRGSPVYKAYADAGAGGEYELPDRGPHIVGRVEERPGPPASPAERWLASTICPHGRDQAPAFAGTATELRAAAEDPSLPGPLRRRARGLLAND